MCGSTLTVERWNMIHMTRVIPTLVVTGGPCGGKSTVTEEIIAEYGSSVKILPEFATILLSILSGPPGGLETDKEKWQYLFQNALSSLHLNVESLLQLTLVNTGVKLIICDRGLMDGAAYYPGGKEAFLKALGFNQSEVFVRYDQVLHLVSTAVCNPSVYGNAGNAFRYENLSEAYALDFRTRDVWKDHPNWTLISGERGIESVISQVKDVVSFYVDTEVERKFVFLHPPSESILDRATKTVRILQGYMPTRTENENRLRLEGEKATQTYKSSGSLARREYERGISRSQFDHMWPETEGARIEKIRHTIPYGKYALEVDQYLGDLLGLVTVECEFTSHDEASRFELPEWAYGLVEVTEVDAFKNKNLAVHGLPDKSLYYP
jgi:CYTH domain-containing protein